MNKNFLTAIILTGLFSWTNAQIKIQAGGEEIVTAPNANLEIVKSPVTSTVLDGFLVPKLTVVQLDAKDGIYTNDQDGAMVFVTDGPGTADKKTSRISSPGFYYYIASEQKWSSVRGDAGNGSFIPKVIEVMQPNQGDELNWTQYKDTYNYFIITTNVTQPASLNFPKVEDFKGKTIYLRNLTKGLIIYTDLPKILGHPAAEKPTDEYLDLGQLTQLNSDTTQQFYSDGARWYLIGKQ